MTLHETKVTVDRFARDYDPEPNPPRFDTDTIITTLDYLTKGHGGNVKSLVELLSKSQDSIQNILLSLKRHLVSVHCLHEKCRVLRMYRLFVGLLLREFHLQLGGSWAFVLRDVIYTLLHNMHAPQQMHRRGCVTYNSDLFCMCCELLHNVCEVAVQHCPTLRVSVATESVSSVTESVSSVTESVSSITESVSSITESVSSVTESVSSVTESVSSITESVSSVTESVSSVTESVSSVTESELGRFLSAITSTLIPYVTQDRGDDVGRLVSDNCYYYCCYCCCYCYYYCYNYFYCYYGYCYCCRRRGC
ncbi:hypothetical protein NP493_226g01012 [Ridgeia piscesae]|uniref:Uncharacterized protein n=1 Tax=Ridgeia piscesae TaxID=27915 RepID=A0AAD9UDU9_RIDPI|nr:hypothetical protein NP493_226g01012 [Ridgeia piscesae]